ncbi:hypothetical protein ACLD43_01145 [Clostridium botulinum]|uniref:hypothetical protein n=1 Tax=Clostridium botulinum TaxID=1491 RepID=UPI003A805E67
MDASVHLWFGDKKTQLHIAVDDATGSIMMAYFDTQETLNGYYNVLYQILNTYGVPYSFFTDRRTVFEYKKKNPLLPKRILSLNLVMLVNNLVLNLKLAVLSRLKVLYNLVSPSK